MLWNQDRHEIWWWETVTLCCSLFVYWMTLTAWLNHRKWCGIDTTGRCCLARAEPDWLSKNEGFAPHLHLVSLFKKQEKSTQKPVPDRHCWIVWTQFNYYSHLFTFPLYSGTTESHLQSSSSSPWFHGRLPSHKYPFHNYTTSILQHFCCCALRSKDLNFFVVSFITPLSTFCCGSGHPTLIFIPTLVTFALPPTLSFISFKVLLPYFLYHLIPSQTPHLSSTAVWLQQNSLVLLSAA